MEKYQFIISNVTIAAIYLRERKMGDKRRTTKETRTIKGPISKGLEGLEELNRSILVHN